MVIIRMSPNGKVYEVYIDRYGYGYHKEAGFRTYEKARKFAEALADKESLELRDTIVPPPIETLPERPTTAEEKI